MIRQTLLVIALLSSIGALPALAQDIARYRLELQITWNQENHPFEWPDSGGHMSGLIGVTHNQRYVMFADGRTATSGLKLVAENGRPRIMKAELAEADRRKRIGAVVEADGLKVTPGRMHTEFTATESHPLLSFVTMLAPSPDWFTGAGSVSLRQDGRWRETVELPLWVWDAGTDSGVLDAGRDTGPTDVGTTDVGTTDTGRDDTAATDTGTDAAVDASTDAAVDASFDSHMPTCVDFLLNTVGASALTGSTVGAGDDFASLVCDGTGPEITVLFTAPSTSSYIFDTFGSDFDTVLSVHEPDCSDPVELACSDDTDEELDSTVSVFLMVGEQVLLNIDGLDDEGNYVLNVAAVADTCPDQDVGTAVGPTVVAGGELTALTADNRTGSCSYGGGGRDLAYRWTATGAGDYSFATHNTTVDTVLYLLDGDCSGGEIVCNDDSFVSMEASTVTATLSASQTIIIVVEGFTAGEIGTFDLSITGPT